MTSPHNLTVIEGGKVANGGGPPHDSDMNERIARLEGDAAGGKRVQSALIGIGALMMAAFVLIVTVLVFQVQGISTRMDRLEDKIDALPAELRGIADSITSAITATQSGQPPVIVIERPAEPPAPQE